MDRVHLDGVGHNSDIHTGLSGSGSKWQISNSGGVTPRWRGDGSALFYVSKGSIMAVPIKTENGSVETGAPHALFPVPTLLTGVQYWNYDVSADGQRFLLMLVAPDDVDPL